MFKRLAIILILIALGLSSLACSLTTVNLGSTQRVEGSGKLSSESRAVSGFSSIDLQGSGNLHITLGDSEALTISADDNILPLIQTRVVLGKLVISNRLNTSYTSVNPVEINVTMKSLDGVRISGSGNLEALELSVDKLQVDLPGSGNIVLKGTANRVDITLNGSGTVTCDGLQAKDATVRLNGSGNVRVYASESLDATISGSGEIKYSGNPAKLNTRVPGSGNILP